MRRAPSREAEPRLARKSMIGTWSPEFTVSTLHRILASPISTGLPAANDPWAFPFRLSETFIANELMVFNGTSAGGNFDLGIYDASWARLVSTGSTAGSGNSVWQIVNVADTTLSPGVTYYLVLARDNATANRQRSFSGSLTISQNQLAGVFDSTTDAFPLPNPLTNMVLAATITQIPIIAISARAVF